MNTENKDCQGKKRKNNGFVKCLMVKNQNLSKKKKLADY